MNNRQSEATSPHAVEDDEAHRGTLRHRGGGAWTVLPVTFVACRSGHDADNSDRLRTDEPRRTREPAQRTMIAMPATPAGLYITGHVVMALRHPSIGMGFNWRVNLRTAPGMLAHRSDNPALSRGTRGHGQGDREGRDRGFEGGAAQCAPSRCRTNRTNLERNARTCGAGTGMAEAGGNHAGTLEDQVA